MSTERGGRANHLIVSFDKWHEFGDRPPDDGRVGPARAADIEGRCVDCWGPIAGLIDADGDWVCIVCEICGGRVETGDAGREKARMAREAEDNMANVRVGRGAVYREDARFVLKILPDMDRDREWFERRVTAALEEDPRRGYLRRRDLRSDDHDNVYAAAGFLYAQARLLVSGLCRLPGDVSAIDLRDFDFGKARMTGLEDASADEHVRISGTVPYRRVAREEAMTRMGTTLIAGSAAAFACEVGMKAILITRLDEAEKTHDLWKLYRSLPDDSRARLEGDFPGIDYVIKENRHTFGDWRYFEGGALEHAVQGPVNTDRVLGLGKTARVIVDECVVAGLQYDSHSRYTYDLQSVACLDENLRLRISSRKPSLSTTVKVEFGGHESAIPWHRIMALDPPGQR